MFTSTMIELFAAQCARIDVDSQTSHCLMSRVPRTLWLLSVCHRHMSRLVAPPREVYNLVSTRVKMHAPLWSFIASRSVSDKSHLGWHGPWTSVVFLTCSKKGGNMPRNPAKKAFRTLGPLARKRSRKSRRRLHMSSQHVDLQIDSHLGKKLWSYSSSEFWSTAKCDLKGVEALHNHSCHENLLCIENGTLTAKGLHEVSAQNLPPQLSSALGGSMWFSTPTFPEHQNQDGPQLPLWSGRLHPGQSFSVLFTAVLLQNTSVWDFYLALR